MRRDEIAAGRPRQRRQREAARLKRHLLMKGDHGVAGRRTAGIPEFDPPYTIE